VSAVVDKALRERLRRQAWQAIQRSRLMGAHIRTYPEVEPGEAAQLLRVERSA